MLGRGFHVRYDRHYHYTLGLHGITPERLHLCVICLWDFDVGTDTLTEANRPLQYLEECFKDACCVQIVGGCDHFGETRVELALVNIYCVVVCLTEDAISDIGAKVFVVSLRRCTTLL